MSEGHEVLRRLWTLLNSHQYDINEVKSLLSSGRLLGCLFTQLKTDDEEGYKRIRPGILLHYAATQHDSGILCSVLTLYRRRDCLPKAMLTRNVHQETPLLAALSVQEHCLPNVLILCRTCKDMAPGAFVMTDGSGSTLFHHLLRWEPPSPHVVSIAKFLLDQEECQSLLLQKAHYYRDEMTPLQLAHYKEGSMKSSIDFDVKGKRTVSDVKMGSLNVYRQLKEILDIATAEQEVGIILKKSVVEEERRITAKKEEIASLIIQHIEAENWHIAVKFMFVEDEEAALMALCHIVDHLLTSEEQPNINLPLDEVTVKRLAVLLEWSPSISDLCYVTWYLSFATKDTSMHQFVWNEEMLMTKILSNLRLPDANLQTACIDLLKNLAETRGDRDTSNWVQPLNVVKEFSSSSHARRIAGNVLNILKIDCPINPGQWSVEDVCDWMLNQKHLDRCESYAKILKTNEIDGLKLMELSFGDLASMGIKGVAEQQSIIDIIDYLRLLNKKAKIGKRDIFLSYSHVNLKLAKQVKNALNEAGYSVWIDEAGIRPGHKWRNEIADGIEGCSGVLFVMTDRSAHSVYCIDELGLAEDMKKPIFTMECEHVKNIDPGLRLIIMSRQWVDCVDESQFEAKVSQLISALKSNGVHPTGVETEKKVEYSMTHSKTPSELLHSSSSLGHAVPVHSRTWDDMSEEMDKWKTTVELLLQGMDKRLSQLEDKFKELDKSYKQT